MTSVFILLLTETLFPLPQLQVLLFLLLLLFHYPFKRNFLPQPRQWLPRTEASFQPPQLQTTRMLLVHLHPQFRTHPPPFFIINSNRFSLNNNNIRVINLDRIIKTTTTTIIITIIIIFSRLYKEIFQLQLPLSKFQSRDLQLLQRLCRPWL